MWITVLVMAFAVSLEPFRIGMVVLMLSRPRPVLQLSAFLAGGFAMGTTVGAIVLFVLRPALSGSHQFTLPRVQIAIGAMALIAVAVVASNVLEGRFARKRPADTPDDGGDDGEGDGRGRLATRVRRVLTGPSSWVAAVAGLGIALPSVDYLAVLAVIVASSAAPLTQVGALAAFGVVAFALVEIPLITYLAAPDLTRASMARLDCWIRTRRRREVAALLAGLGCVLILIGIAGR